MQNFWKIPIHILFNMKVWYYNNGLNISDDNNNNKTIVEIVYNDNDYSEKWVYWP